MPQPTWSIERQWNGRVVAKRDDKTFFQVILDATYRLENDPSRTVVNVTDEDLAVHLDWMAATGRLWSLA